MSDTPLRRPYIPLTPQEVAANHSPTEDEPDVCPVCTRLGVSGAGIKTKYPCAPARFAAEAMRRLDL